jgi:transposase
MSKKSNRFPRKFANELYAWCWITVANMQRCGHPLNQLPPRSAAFPKPFHEWVRKQGIDTGLRHGINSEERDRIKPLERENKELRRANEILKLASAFFAQAEPGRRLES